MSRGRMAGSWRSGTRATSARDRSSYRGEGQGRVDGVRQEPHVLEVETPGEVPVDPRAQRQIHAAGHVQRVGHVAGWERALPRRRSTRLARGARRGVPEARIVRLDAIEIVREDGQAVAELDLKQGVRER